MRQFSPHEHQRIVQHPANVAHADPQVEKVKSSEYFTRCLHWYYTIVQSCGPSHRWEGEILFKTQHQHVTNTLSTLPYVFDQRKPQWSCHQNNSVAQQMRQPPIHHYQLFITSAVLSPIDAFSAQNCRIIPYGSSRHQLLLISSG